MILLIKNWYNCFPWINYLPLKYKTELFEVNNVYMIYCDICYKTILTIKFKMGYQEINYWKSFLFLNKIIETTASYDKSIYEKKTSQEFVKKILIHKILIYF